MAQPQDLQAHIDHLPSLPLEETIQEILRLVPGLTPSVSPAADRLITHDNYTGTAHLDKLGKLYLQTGSRCIAEHASLATRLSYLPLDALFLELYERSDDIRNAAITAGTATEPSYEGQGCPCCSGEPSAVILMGFADGESLYFEEEEYRRLWGNVESVGTRLYYEDGDSKRRVCMLMASKEQVGELMERERGAMAML
ncbi:hypothetical protein P168DRAFT_293629 [Aspergillus campestris IBT 28561]|uniref:Uncharacterized protein n=1 Tax=Aspergillus campestris (strain IBT 28561) TaxID=1392248 RepID=A0A2I1CRX5_ASPC2|nr:uncharacterized protein P168DRAFT_293629 [Aspergillus campestris IBT 28561]PKY00368.1 hypothetical protein P168DRAFT_293629 [Aspergillus campestris IBT 28561]